MAADQSLWAELIAYLYTLSPGCAEIGERWMREGHSPAELIDWIFKVWGVPPEPEPVRTCDILRFPQ